MQPALDAVAMEHEDVDLVVVDATQEPDLAAELRVLGTPTVIAVRDGVEVTRFTGRRTRAELSELFSALSSGEAVSVSRLGRGDRVVWSVAGVALAGVGLAIGPAWWLVAVGAGVAAFANLPR